MTTKEIAAKILEYRRASGLLMPGQLQADIGPEAMGEAIQRRWLIADESTGFLAVTTQQQHIVEMQELAEAEETEVEETKPTEESRTAAMQHAGRNLREGSFAAYASGQPAAPSSPVTPGVGVDDGTPTTSTPNNAGTEQGLVVGEDVTIADEGNAYQAKVKAVNDDGTYELSFGEVKPPTERPYRREEIQKTEAT